MEMYFLLRGSVRMCRNPPDQDASTMATGGDDRKQAVVGGDLGETVEAGDIFGELALFPGA